MIGRISDMRPPKGIVTHGVRTSGWEAFGAGEEWGVPSSDKATFYETSLPPWIHIVAWAAQRTE